MTRENTYEKYWTDGKTNKRCSECPGEGWREGVTANRPSSKPVRVTTIATGEYLDFPSICAAARHYKVSDSKLGYAANGKYKQHKGLKVDFI
jgi:hypothetical protein